VICPSGCSANPVSSSVSKNISLFILVETSLEPAPSHPDRGAFRDRHERGVDAMDAAALARDFDHRAVSTVSDRSVQRRTMLIADGEVVWF
jgi:hypothetical protein